MAYQKQLQALFHDYEKHIGGPGTLRDAVRWGLKNGRLAEPKFDPEAALMSDLKSALRAETRTDDQGREYHANAAVTFTDDGGIQAALWGDLDRKTTPHEFLVEMVAQRRKGILDDRDRLKSTVDHINDAHPDKHIQLVLDFTEDVAEREAMRGADEAAE